MMPTVFVALAQFSHYSDVLRTGCIELLAERFRVVVLTPAIDAAVAERDRYPRGPTISYARVPLARPRLWNVFDKYLRVPLTRAFDHLSYMRHFYERPHASFRKLLMRARILFPRWLFTTDRLTRWEMRFAGVPDTLKPLFQREHPVLVITATPGFTPFEAEVIVAAKALGIRTAAININHDNLTSNGKMMRKTDFLAVWNSVMIEDAKSLHGYRDEELAIAGCLRFDHYFADPKDPAFPSRETFLRSKGLDPQKSLIVLAGPTPSNYPPRRELVEGLVKMRRAGHIAGEPNILIRIHPNDALDTYAGLHAPWLHFERAGRQTRPDSAGGQKIEMGEDDLMNLSATLRYADVVINFVSTIIIEAAIFDRPVITIGFPSHRRVVYEYEYNRGMVEAGGVRRADDIESLAAEVNAYLADPARDHDGRRRCLAKYVPFRDGKSAERTVAFIERIITAS
ncbi:hypothetical protein C4552_02770 [Candidatus Parcubacteria bacterium]|nr:MAG: hypothetical protein C4552_02770 [Candidatus Parcubacteria bacterium]